MRTLQRLIDPADDAGGQQRVAAQVEEVVADLDLLEVEQLAPDLRQLPRSACGARRCRRRALPGRSSGEGSALRSSLPLASAGTTSSEDEQRSGSYRLGERLAERRRAELAGVGSRCRGGDDVGDEALVALASLPGDHDTVGSTAGVVLSAASISPSSTRWPRIFTWWSSRPRNSSDPSGWRRTQVAGAIHTRAGRRANGSGRKRSARQLGSIEIAARQRRRRR